MNMWSVTVVSSASMHRRLDFFKDERFSPDVIAMVNWRILNTSCALCGFLGELPGLTNQTLEYSNYRMVDTDSERVKLAHF